MSSRVGASNEIKKCRLCLQKTATYINIFQGNFHQKIFDLTSIEIPEDDGYFNIACLNCVEEVQKANNTKNRIIENQNKLKSIQENKMLQNTTTFNYPEVVLGELSEELTTEDVDQVVTDSTFDILSGCGEFVVNAQDRVHEFHIKPEIHSDSNDIMYEAIDLEENNSDDFKSSVTESKPGQEIKVQVKKNETLSMNSILVSNREVKKKLRKRTKTSKHKIMRCDQCDLDFQENKYAYYLHMSKHKKSQCNICGNYVRSDNINKHIENHNSGPKVCDLCGAVCKSIESLRGHVFYMHRKSKDEYKCDQCDRSFRMKYKLGLHQQKEHIGIRGHTCSTCKKAFFTLKDMNQHIKMTHLKLRPHVCPHCSRGFSSKYALKTHVRQHTNETPYKCFICGEGFRQNVSLRTHLKSKHNIEEAKNFPCEFCEKAFSSDFALKVHYRLHSDDNYKCEHCEECFQQKVFLINHLKSVHNLTEVEIDVNFARPCIDGDEELLGT